MKRRKNSEKRGKRMRKLKGYEVTEKKRRMRKSGKLFVS